MYDFALGARKYAGIVTRLMKKGSISALFLAYFLNDVITIEEKCLRLILWLGLLGVMIKVRIFFGGF